MVIMYNLNEEDVEEEGVDTEDQGVEEEGADTEDQGVGEEGVDLKDHRSVSGKDIRKIKALQDGGVHKDDADEEKARKEDSNEG